MSTTSISQLLQKIREEIRDGRIAPELLLDLLENPARLPDAFPISYDQDLGLMSLIRSAVGPDNLSNICPAIHIANFKLAGRGICSVKCRVEANLYGESSEQAMQRLAGHGPAFGNAGDLAGFQHDHPDEMRRWLGGVRAIGTGSQWKVTADCILGPHAYVNSSNRLFDLGGFGYKLSPKCGILLLEM